ncbi:MAG: hypothetical protein LUK37_12410 [Clostridia bacterium]|nr:hypothetical protein [Clostridia bacterium]
MYSQPHYVGSAHIPEESGQGWYVFGQLIAEQGAQNHYTQKSGDNPEENVPAFAPSVLADRMKGHDVIETRGKGSDQGIWQIG